MAMTLTYDDSGLYRKIIADFVAVGGVASATTKKIAGRLVKVMTDPGTPAPTASWDLTLTDSTGVNLFLSCANAAALVARSATVTEETYLLLSSGGIPLASSIVVNDVLTIGVANANVGAGRIVYYWTPL